MRLREKLIHYTNDLGDVDLKQEAIATIEHIAQYMDEDELLHHNRPLALAYLALTEAVSVSVVRCKDCKYRTEFGNCGHPRQHGILPTVYPYDFCSYGERKDEANES